MAGKRYNDLANMQTHGFGGYKGKARKAAKQHSANMKELNRQREAKRELERQARVDAYIVRRQRDPNEPYYVMW